MKTIKDTPMEERYARKCDITGEGMNEGFCLQDGLMYIANEKDLIKKLREKEFSGDEYVGVSDEDMKEMAYEEGTYYWTTWYETLEEEDEWYTKEGKEMNSNNN